VAPAGLAWSTADDMGRYLITLLQNGVGPDGNRIVSAENLHATWQPQVAVTATSDYGLGWFVDDYHGLRLIHHGGNTLGFSSDLAFLPDEGIGIVVLANAQAANAFTEGMRNRLLELLYGLSALYDEQIDYALEQSESTYAALMAQIADVPSDLAAETAGLYISDVLGPVTLSIEDDELILDAGEFRTRLKLAIGDVNGTDVTFVAADPPIPGTPFQLRNDGQQLILELETDAYTFERVDDAAATPVAA
jgi:hypothetical protein